MTEDEIKFLEVIYNRGSLAEQSYLNYVHARLGSDASDAHVTREVEVLFTRLEHSGFIQGSPQPGLYSITPLGKEKFESLTEPAVPGLPGQFYYVARRPRFHLSRRIWIAIAALITIFSIALSSIIGHWDLLVEKVKIFTP